MLNLSFSAPLVLGALVALPGLWLLLRVTPPRPRRVFFPALAVVADLPAKQASPARMPWWILLLRLATMAAVILGLAGPVWNPSLALNGGSQTPLLLLVDNQATAARDWPLRLALAKAKIAEAEHANRLIAVVGLAELAGEITLGTPAAKRDQAQLLVPRATMGGRQNHLSEIKRFFENTASAETLWITDGLDTESATAFAKSLSEAIGNRTITVYKPPHPQALFLSRLENGPETIIDIDRVEAGSAVSGVVVARDAKGRAIAQTPFTWAVQEAKAQARFTLPTEISNAITHIGVEGEASAVAVKLVDDRARKRRVGVLSNPPLQSLQPLLSPSYYIVRALEPFADVRQREGDGATAIPGLISDTVSTLILADAGVLAEPAQRALTRFMESGGVVVRFAGDRMATEKETLTPVRLREKARGLSGVLSWETPKSLGNFAKEGPFSALDVPGDARVRRQVLAEPDAALEQKTWASLSDGTPLVTAERRGRGLLVLFHVAADPSWSDLPLSGVFVEMLRAIVGLSSQGAVTDGQMSSEHGDTALQKEKTAMAPRQTLDGFGRLGPPAATAQSLSLQSIPVRGEATHPAGFYGPPEAEVAVNVLGAEDRIEALDLSAFKGHVQSLEEDASTDLRLGFFTAALVLLILDTIAALKVGGRWVRRGLSFKGITAACVLGFASTLLIPSPGAQAQTTGTLSRETITAAQRTRLAYVITGNARLDETSRAGLEGLTAELTLRTAFEPGTPVGIDPAHDDISLYPFLYWPIDASVSAPSTAAMQRLAGYMKNGGTVVFDTRDALTERPDSVGDNTRALRGMLSALDIPALQPLTARHVLSRTFYLIDALPGRTATGQTWLKASTPSEEEAPEKREGDSISPLVIVSNDLAAAWAIDANGQPLNTIIGGGERQREQALRGGINLVMYTLTGNYKADQVHIAPLLDRLGQ